MSTRFTSEAAAQYRSAVQKAGGVEIFAIGKLNSDGFVASIEVHCRGNKNSVPALRSRPKPGEVVIHNHPSGILEASTADMYLANLYGEDGIGVVIVNNEVDRAQWVVEPHRSKVVLLDEAEIEHIFKEKLPSVVQDFESRTGQLEMALEITRALNNGEIAMLEAGTGTGKSLAYLIPSVLWAIRNESRIVVATYTINLQSQLVSSDIPILKAAGLEFEYALVKGRGNYICRRKLAEHFKLSEGSIKKQLQLRKDSDSKDLKQTLLTRQAFSDLQNYHSTLKHINDFTETSTEGTRSDLTFPISDDVWEDIGSDHDQTLRARCPHYSRCFYYEARRQAAKAHLLIANHHIVMIDMMIKSDNNGEGILPTYNRAILDEGHHIEDAATSMFRKQLSSRSLRRSLSPLKQRKEKPNALERLTVMIAQGGQLFEHQEQKALQLIDELRVILPNLWELSEVWLQEIANETLSPELKTLRLKPDFAQTKAWIDVLSPIIKRASVQLGTAADRLTQLEEALEDIGQEIFLKDPQPFMDIQRVRRKLLNHSGFLQLFSLLENEEDLTNVRWIEKARGRHNVPTAELCLSPIEIGPTLRDQFFSKLKSVTMCSATLTVNQNFEHYKNRIGLGELPPHITSREGILPSPFNYNQCALLVIPSTMPPPNHPEYLERCAHFITEAIRASQGGTFVLCTSYFVLRKLHAMVSEDLPEYRVFRHGEMSRAQLLQRFIQTPNAVLFGADSFWEGVNVKGEALRQVIITKLPFKVPTDPVQQARHELIEAQGQNPFTHYSLPQAALRLRQGFGRLIRSQSDRGTVVILDSRIKRKWYGKMFLHSLPPLKHCVAPESVALQQLRSFFNQQTDPLEVPI